jgi:FKBP-type peptidyl-prolyl cis-trans isomerase (trigger factor)
MKSEITREENGNIVLKITVPAKKVDEAREKAVEELAKKVTVPGFRKGNVPKNIAKERVSQELLQEETLKKVLPEAYTEAVKEHKITPIMNPKLHVEAMDEGKDLVFEAVTCEDPEIDLGNYKDSVKNVTAKSKIVVPGKEEQKPNLDEIITEVIKNAKVTIPQVLIEQETTRLLSQMLEELKSLGLTLDQFLANRGKTSEDLRKEYEEQAEKDLKIEFVLRKIADQEKITVEEKDITDAMNTVQDEKQKQQLMQNPYLLAAIIRQQKTLDFLATI